MTPEEKAKELVEMFSNYCCGHEHMDYDIEWNEELLKANKKICALICVNEILNTTYMQVHKYWAGVKNEIEKL